MSVLIEDKAVVLFQGDSVTDVGRSRDNDINLGGGYPTIVSSWFQALYPEKQVKFINRGISGNRVKDLQGRWKEDCLDIKPTWVSILIGINDCWRRYDNNDPTSVEKFEAVYRDILTQIRQNSKNTNIILCEPFVLPILEDRRKWRVDLDPKIHAVRDLAREFNTYYIPLDGIFAQASTRCEPSKWTLDGVHPTNVGHALIAQNWLKTVKAI